MELRFLKGNFPTGKFKLQQREFIQFAQGGGAFEEWHDVPMVEDKPKEKSLEEKFNDYVGRENGDYEHFCKQMARIAEQHFAQKKS